jgi:transcriptional regulator with PAS, ATPase and Fis domain
MIIHIPPLIERTDDIPVLVRHFLNGLDSDEVSCSPEAMDLLMRYNWPGNVRELKSAIECALSLISKDADAIEVIDLPAAVSSSSPTVPFESSACRSQLSTLADNERDLIIESLEQNNWNMAKTARLLGISRANLYEKTKKFKLSRPKS